MHPINVFFKQLYVPSAPAFYCYLLTSGTIQGCSYAHYSNPKYVSRQRNF